jgi:hypothetical protein
MWGIEDECWQPSGSYKNRDEGQELGSSSPLNRRGQLQSRELEQIVTKAWGAGSEEEGGRKWLVRRSRTFGAAIGARLRGSGGLVLRRVASKGAGVPSRVGARSLVAR